MRRSKLVLLVLPVALVALVSIGLAGPVASESDSGWLVLGPVDEPPPEEPGPHFVHSLAFMEWDPVGGESAYELRVIAGEWEEGSIGQVTVSLEGRGLALCSARGPGAFVDANTEPSEPGEVAFEDFGGEGPLGDYSCGTAYGMAVDINSCKADLQFHGYLHSDYPSLTFMGPVTANVDIKKRGEWDPEASPKTFAQVEIFTPAETIHLNGPVFGDVFMSDC